MDTISLGLVMTFLLSLGLLTVLSRYAGKLNLLDTPGARKQHIGEVPMVGGIAIFLSILPGIFYFNLAPALSTYHYFLISAAFLVVSGMLDDMHELSAKWRFPIHITAVLLMIYAGDQVIDHLGDLLFWGPIHLSSFYGALVTVLGVVGIINAMNMMDGLDGCAGGIFLVQLCLLLGLTQGAGFIRDAQVLTFVIAGLLGFLALNFPFPGRARAKVFMGDAGSTLLGFIVAWYFVHLTQGPSTLVTPVTMLWVALVPLFDCGHVMFRRLKRGKSLFDADRNHIHHILLDLGFSPLQIVLLLMGISVLAGRFGIAASRAHVAEGGMFVSFVSLFLVYILVHKGLRLRIKALARQA